MDHLRKCPRCKDWANPESYRCPRCGLIFRNYRIRQVVFWLTGLAVAAWAFHAYVPAHHLF